MYLLINLPQLSTQGRYYFQILGFLLSIFINKPALYNFIAGKNSWSNSVFSYIICWFWMFAFFQDGVSLYLKCWFYEGTYNILRRGGQQEAFADIWILVEVELLDYPGVVCCSIWLVTNMKLWRLDPSTVTDTILVGEKTWKIVVTVNVREKWRI